MTETAENPRKLRGWRLAAAVGAAGLVLLAAAGAILWQKRIPIAEGLVKDRLAGLGLAQSDLTVASLTPWKAEVRGVTLGAAGAARLASLTADLSWPSWTRPEITRLVLDGLHLRVAVGDGGVAIAGLEKLKPGPGGGAGAALPEVLLTNALVDLDIHGTAAAISLTRLRLSRAADGAVTFSDMVADVIHPQGQLSLSGGGKWDGGKALALHLTVDGGEGRAGAFAAAQVSGPVTVTADATRPRDLDASADLTLKGLTGPAGLAGDGSLKAAVKGGKAALDLTLAEQRRGIAVTAGLRGDLTAPGLPVTLKADVAVPDLSGAGLAQGLTGRAALHLETAFDGRALPGLSLAALPPVTVAMEASDLAYPGVEGPWKVRATARVASADGLIVVRFPEDASVSGAAFGGDAALALSGATLHLDPGTLRPVHLGLDGATGTISGLRLAGAEVAGPLAVQVTPGRDGAVTLKEGAFQNADLAFRFLTPAATVKAGATTLALRTAKAAGRVRLTAQPVGRPAVAADIGGLAAALPSADAEVHGLRLAVASRGGADAAWTFTAGAAEIVHGAVAPLAAEAKGRWTPRRLTAEGTLRQKEAGLVVGIAVSRDNASGAGHLRLDSLPLDLGRVPGGIGALTPLLSPFVKSLTGTLQFSAQADLGRDGLEPVKITGSLKDAGLSPAASLLPASFKGALAGIGSLSLEATVPPGDPGAGRGAVNLAGGNLRLRQANATGIEGRLELEHLWPPRTPPGQEFRVARIDAGLPVTDGRLVFQVEGADRMTVERAEVTAVGGRISAAGFTVGAGAPATVPIAVSGLGLNTLAEQFEVAGLKADGVLDGRLPLVLGDVVAVKGGLLRARQAGGLVFRPPVRTPKGQGDARMDLVLDILEDLRFQDLSLSLDGDLAKDVQAVVRMKGHNPKVQGGRAVDLTVQLSGNIGEAVRAEFQNFDLRGLTGSGLPPAQVGTGGK